MKIFRDLIKQLTALLDQVSKLSETDAELIQSYAHTAFLLAKLLLVTLQYTKIEIAEAEEFEKFFSSIKNVVKLPSLNQLDANKLLQSAIQYLKPLNSKQAILQKLHKLTGINVGRIIFDELLDFSNITSLHNLYSAKTQARLQHIENLSNKFAVCLKNYKDLPSAPNKGTLDKLEANFFHWISLPHRIIAFHTAVDGNLETAIAYWRDVSEDEKYYLTDALCYVITNQRLDKESYQACWDKLTPDLNKLNQRYPQKALRLYELQLQQLQQLALPLDAVKAVLKQINDCLSNATFTIPTLVIKSHWTVCQVDLKQARGALKAAYKQERDLVGAQLNFTKACRDLIRKIWTQSIELLGKPPCAMELALLGSMARGDAVLYSDVEAMLWVAENPRPNPKLIENANLSVAAYVKSLTTLLSYQFKSLGEAEDTLTPGFHLDIKMSFVDESLLNQPGQIIAHFMSSTSGVNFLVAPDYLPLLQALPLTEEASQLAKDYTHEKDKFLAKPLTELKREVSEIVTAKFGINPQLKLTLLDAILFSAWQNTHQFIESQEYKALQDGIRLKDFMRPLTVWLNTLALWYDIKSGHPVQIIEAFIKRVKYAGVAPLPLGFMQLLKVSLLRLIALRLEVQEKAECEIEVIKRADAKIEGQVLSEKAWLELAFIQRAVIHPWWEAINDYLEALKNPALTERPDFTLYWQKLLQSYLAIRNEWANKLGSEHPLLQVLADYPSPNGYRPGFAYREQCWHESLSIFLESVAITTSRINPKAITVKITRIRAKEETSTCFLKSNIVESLQEPKLSAECPYPVILADGKLNVMELKGKLGGRHAVFPLEHQGMKVYLKVYPDAPSMNEVSKYLQTAITGGRLPWSELWLWQSGGQHYFVLVSEAIPGVSLRDWLLKKQPLKLNKLAYSQQVIAAMLLQPEDQGTANIKVITQEGIEKEQELVSIDNDRILVKAFEGKALRVKSALFCCDEMNELIHPLVREQILSLDITQLLTGCWEHIKAFNSQLEALGEKVIQRASQKPKWWVASNGGVRSLLLPLFNQEQFLFLLERLQRIIEILRQNNQLVFHSIHREISPLLANHYAASFQLPDILNRYAAIAGNEVKQGQSTRTLREYEQSCRGTVIEPENLLSQWQKDRKQLENFITNLLQTFDGLAQVKMELLKLNAQPFLQLHSRVAQEQVLQEIMLCEQTRITQESVLENFLLELMPQISLRRLTLRYCKHLTDKQLEKILVASPELIELDIRGCTGLTKQSFRFLSKHSTLRELRAQELLIQQIKISQPVGVLSFPELVFLDLSQCKRLVSLDIIALKLIELRLLNCIRLVKIRALKALNIINLRGTKEYAYELLDQFTRNCPQLNQLEIEKTIFEEALIKCNYQILELIFQNSANSSWLNEPVKDNSLPLIIAVQNGNHTLVDFLLRKGANPDLIDKNGQTAFHYACVNDHLTIAEKVLPNNLQLLNAPYSYYHQSLLTYAICKGKLELVDFLLSKGAKPDEVYENGRTALHYACNIGHLAISKKLFPCNLKFLDKFDLKGKTPLMYAARKGKSELVDFLLSKGAQRDVVNKYGCTVFHYACWNDHLVIAEKVLPVNLDLLNVPYGNYQQTLLMYAAGKEKSELVDFLLSKGANFDIMDKDGRTAFHYACGKGNLTIAERLLTSNPEVLDKFDLKGKTSLIYAARNGKLDLVDFLLSKGANPDLIDKNGQTAFHYACEEEHLQIAEKVFPINLNLLNMPYGCTSQTILMYAARNGNLELVDFLFSKGANPDLIDKNGRTAFHYACEEEHLQIAEKVFPINLNLLNVPYGYTGQTILMYAARNGKLELVDFLLSKGANPDLIDKNGRTAFHYACEEEHLQIAEKVFPINLDLLNMPYGYTGQTIFLYVICRSYFYLMDFMLNKGANPDVLDKDGRTAFHYACKKGHLAFAKKILSDHFQLLDKSDNEGNTSLLFAASAIYISEEKHLEIIKFLLAQGANLHHKNHRGEDVLELAQRSKDVNLINYLKGEMAKSVPTDTNHTIASSLTTYSAIFVPSNSVPKASPDSGLDIESNNNSNRLRQ